MKECALIVNPNRLKKYNYSDIFANAPDKMMAWMLIRNECKRLKMKVPTLDQIMEL
jgi:hypothetical protein